MRAGEALKRITRLFQEDRLEEAREEVDALLEQVEEPELRAKLLLRKLKVLMELGAYSEALSILKREAKFLDENLSGTDKLLLTEVEVHLSQATGNPSRARRALAKLGSERGPVPNFIRARFYLTAGELDRAAELFRQVLAEATEPGVREPAAVNLANILAIQGRFGEAKDLESPNAHLLVWNYIKSFVLVAEGKPSEALQVCKEGWEAVRHQRHLRGMTHWAIVQAVAWAALGEREKAELYIDLAVEISEKTEDLIARLRALAFKELLSPSSPEKPLKLAERAGELGFKLERAIALYAAARALALKGEDPRPLVDEVISAGYLGLLRFMAQAAPEPLAGTPFEALPSERPRLKLLTLGGCRAVWGKRSAELPGRLGELLAYLALTARNPRAKEEVAAAFWPKAPLPRALKNYYDAVTRIKKALRDAGIPVPRSREHGAATLPFDFSIDLLEFEGLVSTAKSLRRAGDAGRAAEFYAEAASLYRGGFLPRAKHPLLKARRALAREEYLEALRFLVRFWAERNREEARRWALRLLEAEPSDPEALKILG